MFGQGAQIWVLQALINCGRGHAIDTCGSYDNLSLRVADELMCRGPFQNENQGASVKENLSSKLGPKKDTCPEDSFTRSTASSVARFYSRSRLASF
jgi:hypothetical protein